MNVLILAAGYATRLHPLTLNQPKPLLPVAGKPMMEWVVDNLAPIPDLEKVCIVTNARFAGHFENWAGAYAAKAAPRMEIQILADGSTCDADKLGAIGDIGLAIREAQLDASDLLVVAGDNLFSESLEAFGRFCAAQDSPVLGVYDVGSPEQARQYGVVSVGAGGEIVRFEEKPAAPESSTVGIALYYFPQSVLGEFETYLGAGHNPDQPGRFIQWLYQRRPVLTWPVPGTWFDIGSRESLEEADRRFARFVQPELFEMAQG